MSAATQTPVTFYRGEDPLRADKLNAAFNERVLRTGDTMIGPFYLMRDPQTTFEAATKQYVDSTALSLINSAVVRTFNGRSGFVQLLGTDVTSALGYTPYDSKNPAGYVTSANAVTSFNARVGPVTLTTADVQTVYDAPVDGKLYGRRNGGWWEGVRITGGTLTGPLTLFRDPQGTLEAATKQYVDTTVAAIPAGVTSFNTRTGAITLTTADVTAVADTTYVNVGGDTMTGALGLPVGSKTTPSLNFGVAASGIYGGANQLNIAIQSTTRLTVSSGAVTATVPVVLPADPANPLESATKQYVDTKVGGIVSGVSSFNTRTGAVTLNNADISSVGNIRVGGTLPADAGFPEQVLADNAVVTQRIGWNTYVDGTGNWRALNTGKSAIWSFDKPTGLFSLYNGGASVSGGSLIALSVAATIDATGNFTTYGTATDTKHLVTKGYVDGLVTGGGAYLPLTGGTLTNQLRITAPANASNVGQNLLLDGSITPTIRFHDGSASPTFGLLYYSGSLWMCGFSSPAGTGEQDIAFFNTGSIEFRKPLSMATGRITVLGDPQNPQDAATKNYVDGKLTSLGNVVGPGGATLNAVPRYSDISGTLIKDSTFTLQDNGTFTLKSGANTVLEYGTTGTSTSGGLIIRAMPPHGQSLSITPRSDVNGALVLASGAGFYFDSALNIGAGSATNATVVQLSSVASGTTRGIKIGSGLLNLPPLGADPTAPTNGDIWTTATGAFARIAGVSVPLGASGVSSFNTRTGAVTLSSADVTTALTYTPYNSTNPAGYATTSYVSSNFKPIGAYTPNQSVDVGVSTTFGDMVMNGGFGTKWVNSYMRFGWNGRVQSWVDGGGAYVELRDTRDYISNQNVDVGAYVTFGRVTVYDGLGILYNAYGWWIGFGWDSGNAMAQLFVNGGYQGLLASTGWVSAVLGSYVTRRGNINALGYDYTDRWYVGSNDTASWFYVAVDSISSDERIKFNIAPTKVDALGLLCSVPVEEMYINADVVGYWKSIGGAEKTAEERATIRANTPAQYIPIGVVAQKLKAVLPELVEIGDLHPPPNPDPDSPVPADLHKVKTGDFWPYFLRAIQQLTTRIEALEARA